MQSPSICPARSSWSLSRSASICNVFWNMHTYMWQCGCLGGFGRWVDGWVTPSYPPNPPMQPPPDTHTATRWHPKTCECVCAPEFWCMYVCVFLKLLTRSPATSPHPPMHTETPIHPSIDPFTQPHPPIDPFTWVEGATSMGQIETSVESKLRVCRKSFSYLQKGEQQIFHLAYFKCFYCYFWGSYGPRQQILHI